MSKFIQGSASVPDALLIINRDYTVRLELMKLMDINYMFGYIFTLKAVTSSSMLRLKPAGL